MEEDDRENTEKQLWDYLADAHCHPAESLENASFEIIEKETKITKVQHFCQMGTNPKDWSCVELIKSHFKNRDTVRAAYGIHPWYAHSVMLRPNANIERFPNLDTLDVASKEVALNLPSPIPFDEWSLQLRNLLIRDPNSIVGEIGIDRSYTINRSRLRCSTDYQLHLFRYQLLLAAELNRPVSIHCVRSAGLLVDLFKSISLPEFPPKVMLHSFTGSSDSLKLLLRLPSKGDRLFFSFSSIINGDRSKSLEVIKAVPDDRLLLESDCASFPQIESNLIAIMNIISYAKSWPLSKVAHITFFNYKSFLNKL